MALSGGTDDSQQPTPASAGTVNVQEFRVRYCEIDQLGTFYNSRALDWFEMGRTEYLRAIGLPYTQCEAQGAMLPVIDARLQYLGRAGYDDRLRISTSAAMDGKVRIRFSIRIEHADKAAPVVEGYTVHAVVGRDGKPMRPPGWLTETIHRHRGEMKSLGCESLKAGAVAAAWAATPCATGVVGSVAANAAATAPNCAPVEKMWKPRLRRRGLALRAPPRLLRRSFLAAQTLADKMLAE
jgi:acyl-CoA thioester hydrolase